MSQWNQLLLSSVQLLNRYKVAAENPFLVDDFESYFGEQSLLERKYGSNGDPVSLSLSSTMKNSGDYGLQYDFVLGTNGYAGRQISFNKNWSTANALSLWLSNPGNIGNHLTIQIQIGGISFEYDYDYDLTESFEGIVTIPFDDFKPANWEENQQAEITEEITYTYEISGPEELSVNQSELDQAVIDGLTETLLFKGKLENKIVASKISSKGEVEIVPWDLTINDKRTLLTISIAEDDILTTTIT